MILSYCCVVILSCIVVYYRVMISYHCSYDAIILWYYDNIILRPTRFVTTCLCSCRWSRLLYLALTARRFCHFLTRWLRVAVYTTNTTNPNPKPIRHNQPLVSISSPFVSYTVCPNHSGELYYQVLNNPNPKPIRHNQPLVGISPSVSYTVCFNHSGELYY